MNEQEQIRAIAELDGHVFNERGVVENNGAFHVESYFFGFRCPRYITSRDAIVPVIEKQNDVIKRDIVSQFFHGPDLLVATPAQLCEALLRATGKWKP